MAHSFLDELEYENLTGNDLDESQEDRYHAIVEAAVVQLEELLGWPLVPDSWDNQYIEIGKSKSNLSCPDVDDDLDPPDEVVNAYRIFTLQVGDPWLAIDPATEIHSVKYIRGNVTCKEYELDEYVPKYTNGSPSVIKYLGIRKLMCDCVRIREPREFAVDADWAYEDAETFPITLKKVLAEMVADEMDPKKDVRSESVVSHSYTKFDHVSVQDKHIAVLRRYAGPHGLVSRRLV